jgi:hypothetical protein
MVVEVYEKKAKVRAGRVPVRARALMVIRHGAKCSREDDLCGTTWVKIPKYRRNSQYPQYIFAASDEPPAQLSSMQFRVI